MAVEASLQSLLELSTDAFDAVVRDRIRAHEEAEQRAHERSQIPDEAVPWFVLGAQEVALQRREEATLAASMRHDILKQQIATLEGMR